MQSVTSKKREKQRKKQKERGKLLIYLYNYFSSSMLAFESTTIAKLTLKEYVVSRDYFRFCDKNTFSCNCSVFFNYLWCKHSLASMIIMKDASVPVGLEEVIGPRNRGRPSKRGKALDKI